MTTLPEIIDFKVFLEEKLNNGEIIKLTTKYLTSPGDNYGSVMLLTIAEFANNEPKSMQLIVKIPPISSEWFKIFQIEKSFVKELGIYTNILPSLNNFYNEYISDNVFNIHDIFPHYFGGRLSLDNDSEFADNNAILLMENLNLKGYKTGNRNKGFNENETKYVLKNLAILHAMTIAIRRLKPDEFNKNIKPYLRKIDIDSCIEADQQKQMNDLLIYELDTFEEFKEIREKTLKQIDICTEWQTNTEAIYNETPYTTLVHNDLWVNNLMLAYDDNKNVNGVKFIDFQLTICDSLAHDLLFFLLTSVENKLIEKHFDHLIYYYYENFYNLLKQFNCHLDDYTFESFLNEIREQAPIEYFHILYMVRVVMANKDIVPEFKETTNSDFFLDKNLIGPDYYEKLKIIINLYKNKNWI